MIEKLQRFEYFMALAFAFSITFDSFSRIVMWSWLSIWLIVKNTTLISSSGNVLNALSNQILQKKNIAYIPFFLYILISVISLFYSDNITHGLKLFSSRILFLIIPIVGILGVNKFYSFKKIAFAFVLGTLASCIFFVSNTFYEYSIDNAVRISFLQDFSTTFASTLIEYKHRIFFGLSLIVSICFLFYLYPDIKKNKQSKILFISASLFLSGIYFFIIFYSGARSCLLCILTSVSIILLNYMLKIKKRFSIILILLAIGILFLSSIFIIAHHPRFQRFNIKDIQNTENLKSIDPRFETWIYSLDVINENSFWFGTGIGDANDKLLEKYDEKKSALHISHKYRSHNFFLGTMLESGITGTLFVILLLISPFFIRKKENTLITFLICANLFIISMFEHIGGQFFSIMIFAFLLFWAIEINRKEESLSVSKKGLILFFTATILLFSITAIFLYNVKTNVINFNPKQPKTYCNNNYVPMKNLPGFVPGDIPAGTVGYKLDNTVKSVYDKELNSCNMFSFFDLKVLKDDEFMDVSIFCYVSEDFNGNDVKIATSSQNNTESLSMYDMGSKGMWQKLSFRFDGPHFNVPVYMYFNKINVTDFSSLTGFVIFAYPKITIRNKMDETPPYYSRHDRALRYGYLLSDICKYKHLSIETYKKMDVSGWYFDKNSGYSSFEEKTINKTFIGDFILSDSIVTIQQIDCYISPDFDGNLAQLRIETADQTEIVSTNYDLKNKGTWQTLQCEVFPKKEKKLNIYLHTESDNFRSMNGFVIYTNPQRKQFPLFQIYSSFDFTATPPFNEKLVMVADNRYKGYYLNKYNFTYNWITLTPIIHKKREETIEVSSYVKVSEDFNGNEVKLAHHPGDRFCFYNLKEKGKWQKLSFKIRDSIPSSVYLYYTLLNEKNLNNLHGEIFITKPEVHFLQEK